MKYEHTHERGRIAEQKVAAWLMVDHWAVFAPCEADADGHPPMIYSDGWQGVAPDFLCFRGDWHGWVEVKGKTHFTWHPRRKQWQTGIDLNKLKHYREVCKRTGLPLCLLFYHHSDQPSQKDIRHGSPLTCPSGLFGGALSKLDGCIDHFSHAPSAYGEISFPSAAPGIAYWNACDLRCLASVAEVESAAMLLSNHPLLNTRNFPHERNQPGGLI